MHIGLQTRQTLGLIGHAQAGSGRDQIRMVVQSSFDQPVQIGPAERLPPPFIQRCIRFRVRSLAQLFQCGAGRGFE